MSRETLQHLNENTLIGCTDQRDTAWHYRADMQTPVMVGDDIVVGNHYSGFIPVEHVKLRLFTFNAIRSELYAEVANPNYDGSKDSGPDKFRIQVPNHSALIADDNGQILGVNGISYQPHQFSEWLLDNVGTILDDDLGVSSAGLLQNRSQAWVEVSVPETVKGHGDFHFRPNLLACTSFDGSIPTTYKRTIQATVCDNTLNIARGEKGQEFRIKHTAHSLDKVMDVREALQIIQKDTDEFQKELDDLLSWRVSSKEWNLLLKEVLPVDQPNQSKSSSTRNSQKWEELTSLYGHDHRCAPWRGTALGVLQTFNTFDHHYRGIRGNASRAERNMENAIKGTQAKNDVWILEQLGKVSVPA